MRNIRLIILSLLSICCHFSLFAQSQSPRERSVELSAQILPNNGGILLSWVADPSANQYTIYKKELSSTDWGTPLAVLPGTVESFTDSNVLPGQGFEYGVFKKEFDLVIKEFEVPAGDTVSVELMDIFGIGLCCNFGFGYYRLTGCGDTLAYGDDFGFADNSIVVICNNGQPTETLRMTIRPDMFPNSTSWQVRSITTDSIYGTSGPEGTFIDSRPAYGYIYTGIDLPPIHNRGGILLLVENSVASPLAPSLDRLRLDLIRDGWQVFTETAEMTETPMAIRSRIQTWYANQPNLNTLLIIGHVPVPYSGNIYPDTHSENHQGAWAADVYYGELDGNWTDEVVDISTAQFAYNHNVPGDGRFDQDSIPSGVELAVGRIDLSNLPAFEESEIQLLTNYLQKNHLFRNNFYVIPRRALIDDNFGNSFGAPAASGWRNFTPMFGPDKIDAVDYFSTTENLFYLWSYGCGSGSHISAEGIGTTEDFSNSNLKTIFTMLFGSQFGDWDNNNNFLRAPLASGLTLTNCWAGSPPWTLHHMAMGYPIGYSVLATQNSGTNNGIYLDNGPQLVHVALMGDPSLRMHTLTSPENPSAIAANNQVILSWSAVSDTSVLGYHLYRAIAQNGPYELITEIPIDNTNYTDVPPVSGNYHYLIRAVKLETSASGTYFNLSPGAMVMTDFILPVSDQAANGVLTVWPNPARDGLFVETGTQNGSVEILIYDINGREILSQQKQADGTAIYLSFPKSVTAGIYLLTVQTNLGLESRKLVIY